MVRKKVEKCLYKRLKPHCNIGTIGHVDHGKTTLTAAITSVLSVETSTKYVAYEDMDKQVEESQRGITMTATHVEYETEKRHYSHVDCPGHQHYMKNMITGATQMDGVILVVSVTEGPQEQTSEHIILASEVGIEYMVVYVNKVDALKASVLKNLVEIEILELMDVYSFSSDDRNLLVFGSASDALWESEDDESVQGTGSMKELMKLVDDYMAQPVRAVDKPFLMGIEDMLMMPGSGTVVTGKMDCGSVVIGDLLDVVGSVILSTSCVGLEMFHKVLTNAEAGENVGVLLRGMKSKAVKSGFVLSEVDNMKPVSKFECKAYILTKEEGGRGKPFMSDYSPQFFFSTSNVTGKVLLLGTNMFAMPGDTVSFEVVLLEKSAMNIGMSFALREGSVTVGAGFVTDMVISL